MKKILIVDWLDKFGGAERVIASLERNFSFTEVYTLTNVMEHKDLNKIFPNKKISIFQTPLKICGKRFRVLFFTFHYFISKIKISKDAGLIISSSHAVAKGLKKSSRDQIHICYFQARNFKYIWDETNLYFGILRYPLFPLIKLLRKIDVAQAQKPDVIIANSKFVQNWIKEKYNRNSQVIYPPVDLKNFSISENKKDYYVAVGRLVAYKRFDLVVQAFNKCGKKLYIIGDGAEMVKLQSMANKNIVFTGFLQSDEVRQYIESAKAFIHCGVEDFGIAPIEAQACGTPVIAYGKGGVLETVQDRITGILYKEQSIQSILEAISVSETINFDSLNIRSNALRFSEENFDKSIQHFYHTVKSRLNKK